MNILAVQISKTLFSTPSLDQGADCLINLVLRWSILTNHEIALEYFKNNADKVPTLKSKNSVPYWNEIFQYWSESQKIHELVSWSMNSIIDKGFETTHGNYDQHDQDIEGFNSALPDKQHLVEQLAILSPNDAMECLSYAAITWAWHIDILELKTDAVYTGRYRDEWTHKDLVGYVFYALYVSVNEGLLQREFTPEFIEQFR